MRAHFWLKGVDVLQVVGRNLKHKSNREDTGTGRGKATKKNHKGN